MNYKTHNDEHINLNGSSYKGEIITTYNRLVELFGEPSRKSGDGKMDVKWDIQFENGVVGSIYNYKNGVKYGNPDIANIKEWNIGGYKSECVKLINELI